MPPFATTRWSLIESTRDVPDVARVALEQLCRDYRPPVLAFVRRSGYSPADADDLTQEFFADFIERRWYTHADPARGRFRALLLTALRRFLSAQRAREHALKRGGGLHAIELDEAIAGTDQGPEQAFARSWVLTVLDHAVQRLREEWLLAGKSDQFDRLIEYIDGGADDEGFRALAQQLQVRRNTLSVQLHRMRQRLRELVRTELMQTVGSHEALAQELAELRDAAGLTMGD